METILKLWLGIGVLIYTGYWFNLHWEQTIGEVWDNFKHNVILHPRSLYNFIFTIVVCILAGPLALGLIWLKRKKDQELIDRDL